MCFLLKILDVDFSPLCRKPTPAHSPRKALLANAGCLCERANSSFLALQGLRESPFPGPHPRPRPGSDQLPLFYKAPETAANGRVCLSPSHSPRIMMMENGERASLGSAALRQEGKATAVRASSFILNSRPLNSEPRRYFSPYSLHSDRTATGAAESVVSRLSSRLFSFPLAAPLTSRPSLHSSAPPLPKSNMYRFYGSLENKWLSFHRRARM